MDNIDIEIGTLGGIVNYDNIINAPIINVSEMPTLTSADRGYYRYTGSTTASFNNKSIYFWNGVSWKEINGEGGSGGNVNTVSVNNGTPVGPDINKNVNLTINKSTVGLSNVDNTSDMNKPVSTATQNAIAAEADTRSAVDDLLQENIDDEIDRAEGKEAELEDAIDDLTSDLGDKVDKTSVANKVYGTDSQGNQTTYDKNSFGQVNDVTINNTSIVENKVAKIVYEMNLGSDSSNAATVTAIRSFVNSSIASAAAYYLTADVSGNAFATKAALDAGPYYYAGQQVQATRTDYAIVIADETHDGKTARYTYTTNQWAFQYTFNMSFTQAQVDAMNSGITSAKVALYDAHLINTNNPHSVTKAQVGLGNVGNFKAVSTESQTLTDTEKAQARTNIGAGTSSFSGDYNDLSNKPTIPTVGNGTIIINQGGVQKGTFSVNQSGDTTVNLDGSGTTDYNSLTNKPILNQDLTAEGFTAVANTYYRHTGTTGTYTQGVIYYYNGTEYKAIDGSGSGGGTDANAVHYTAETKTDNQKAQARENIGAGTPIIIEILDSTD